MQLACVHCGAYSRLCGRLRIWFQSLACQNTTWVSEDVSPSEKIEVKGLAIKAFLSLGKEWACLVIL
jgi:hypothetical protein